jgi:hypothetical protein
MPVQDNPTAKTKKRPARIVSEYCFIIPAKESVITWTPITKSLLPSLYKRKNYPSLAKRGEGRFYEQYVFSTMDPITN